MDGIDAALLRTDGDKVIDSLGWVSVPYEDTFKIALKDGERAVRQAQGIMEHANRIYSPLEKVIKQSTHLHAQAVHTLLEKTGHTPQEIQVVGYHGQTLYHEPSEGISVIVGCGNHLANLTGISVVNNFRGEDMKLGGQGAPLAPIYHLALARRFGRIPALVINLGGIANVTIMPSSEPQDMIAFDTGPANALVDRLVRQRTNNSQCMDVGGRYGSCGTVHQPVLEKLFEKAVFRDGKNYFSLPTPKSLDTSHLHLIPELDSLSLEDACATLEAFTAKSLVQSVASLNMPIPNQWIAAGGGVKNPVIFTHLKAYATQTFGPELEIFSAEDVGWQSQAIEAQLFAYLAVRHLRKLPFSFPKTTGVSLATCGGDCFQR